MAVFVHAHQIGVAFCRSQLLLEFDLALVIFIGFVFNFNKGETPVFAIIILRIKSD